MTTLLDMAQTEQAKRLAKALNDIGITTRRTKGMSAQASVKTELFRRCQNGVRWTEYGNAIASIWNREAHTAVAEHAQELADQNFTVAVFRRVDGTVGTVFVSTAYNHTHHVQIITEGAT